jgi:hypothetical protein
MGCKLEIGKSGAATFKTFTPGGDMQRKTSIMVLSVAMALVGLTGFAFDTVIAPRPLQAQSCGKHNGKLCAKDCGKECSNGSCCGWLYYYYDISPT